MELLLSSDLDAKLNRLAAEQGRDREALVIEAVERLVSHEAWFMAQVQQGIDAANHGELIDHDAVRALVDRQHPA